MNADAIVNPWTALPAEPPYQLPGDAPDIEQFNRHARPERHLHPELLPEPFVGSADTPVVLLSLIPGLSEEDRQVHARHSFRAAVRRNLHHEPQPYPFYYLDPDEEGPGHTRCRKHLRPVLERVPAEQVAKRLLMVEYFPYHASRFGHERLRLPSQSYSFALVRQAVARNAVVVLLRSARLWLAAVPELAGYARLYRLRSTQNSTLSPRNCPEGFEAVVEALSGDPRRQRAL